MGKIDRIGATGDIACDSGVPLGVGVAGLGLNWDGVDEKPSPDRPCPSIGEEVVTARSCSSSGDGDLGHSSMFESGTAWKGSSIIWMMTDSVGGDWGEASTREGFVFGCGTFVGLRMIGTSVVRFKGGGGKGNN